MSAGNAFMAPIQGDVASATHSFTLCEIPSELLTNSHVKRLKVNQAFKISGVDRRINALIVNKAKESYSGKFVLLDDGVDTYVAVIEMHVAAMEEILNGIFDRDPMEDHIRQIGIVLGRDIENYKQGTISVLCAEIPSSVLRVYTNREAARADIMAKRNAAGASLVWNPRKPNICYQMPEKKGERGLAVDPLKIVRVNYAGYVATFLQKVARLTGVFKTVYINENLMRKLGVSPIDLPDYVAVQKKDQKISEMKYNTNIFLALGGKPLVSNIASEITLSNASELFEFSNHLESDEIVEIIDKIMEAQDERDKTKTEERKERTNRAIENIRLGNSFQLLQINDDDSSEGGSTSENLERESFPRLPGMIDASKVQASTWGNAAK